MPAFIDRTGQQFGRLLIISRATPSKHRKARWNCICGCGNQVVVIGNDMVSGKQISCGCVRTARLLERHFNRVTHRLSRTGVGRSWSNLMERCFNPKNPAFRNYGGRGIVACGFISESPENLLSILGHKPNGLSIDRINNNGHYSCGKCEECTRNGWQINIRWASGKQQMRNVRYNRLVSINGVTKCAAQWDEEAGFVSGMIKQRLARGWRPEKLLEPPQSKFFSKKYVAFLNHK